MPIDPNSTDWLYLLFRNSGQNVNLIVPAALINLVAITGVLLNSAVIYVTARDSRLRGSANFLLAQISLYEVLHQLGHLLLLFLTVTGMNFLDMLTAANWMLLSVFGLNGSMMAITSAAFDRLLMVLGRNFETKSARITYLILHSFICLCYGIYGVQDFYRFALAHPNLPKSGYMHDMLIDPVTQDRFTRDSTIQNCVAIGCYLLIWIVVKVKKEASQQTNSRLLKSLLIIVLVNIGCYLINMAIYQLEFTGASYSDLQAWQLSFINGCLLNIGSGSNAPILYVTSVEYRRAFKKYLMSNCLLKAQPAGSTTRVIKITKTAAAGGNSDRLSASQHRIHPQQNPH